MNLLGLAILGLAGYAIYTIFTKKEKPGDVTDLFMEAERWKMQALSRLLVLKEAGSNMAQEVILAELNNARTELMEAIMLQEEALRVATNLSLSFPNEIADLADMKLGLSIIDASIMSGGKEID